MKIEVVHNVLYGKNRFYPNNDDAKTLCDLMKTKSFTEEHLKRCKKAGWEVTVITKQFNLD